MKKFILPLLIVLGASRFCADALPLPPQNLRIYQPALPTAFLTNLALGKSYQLAPAPNYPLCTDPGDSTQLTDGKYVQGYFWKQQGTVGWQSVSPVSITIDLGQIQPIAGLSFSTAAGTAADVEWPSAILVLLSDDSNTWHYVGDLVALTLKDSFPSTSTYATHRYCTTSLVTKGRFVRLLVVPNGYSGAAYAGFTFVDEIEVYRGFDTFMSQPFAGQSLASVQAFANQKRLGAFLRRRLGNDLADVTRELNSSPSGTNISSLLRPELDMIALAIPGVDLDPSLSNTFSTVFPINDLHSRIFKAQAAIWRAGGLQGVVISQSNRWDLLSPTSTPIPANSTVNLAMMSNEYRAEAFNLSNTGQSNTQVSLVLEGLPGGTNPPYVTVQEVPFTDTQSGKPVAAALLLAPQQAGAYVVQIPSGLTRQIWLTFHPTNVPAGEYHGRIVVTSVGTADRQIPVGLKIYPFSFPSKPTLHVGGWDYSDDASGDYGVSLTNRSSFIALLREHFVDSPWASSVFQDPGEYDQNGHMTRAPDTTAFGAWVGRWPNAANYYVFVDIPGVFGKTGSFAGFAMGTTAFQQAVSDWISSWVGQLARYNIQANQLNLLLVDEPQTTAQDNIIIQYAKIIHLAQPQVHVWEDPIWNNLSQATPDLFQVSDVLCPNLSLWISYGQSYVDFFLKLRDAGHRLWLYTANTPGRLRDPYYLRMQSWFCWKYGAEGAGFWSFADSGGSPSWNEYSSRLGDYSPLFLDAKSVTTGKQMEAIREGVEDYEYLRILRDRVAALKAQGVQTAALTNASNLLASAADRIVPAPVPTLSWRVFPPLVSWDQPKDRSPADTVRLQILDTLVQLSNQ